MLEDLSLLGLHFLDDVRTITLIFYPPFFYLSGTISLFHQGNRYERDEAFSKRSGLDSVCFLLSLGYHGNTRRGKKRRLRVLLSFRFCLHMSHGRRVGHASVCIYLCLERPGARAVKGCSGTANCLVQGKVGVAEYCESNKLNQRLETCFGGATVHAALTLRGSGTWQHME